MMIIFLKSNKEIIILNRNRECYGGYIHEDYQNKMMEHLKWMEVVKKPRKSQIEKP